jgi:hypothetical protein
MVLIESFHHRSHLFKKWTYNDPSILLFNKSTIPIEIEYSQSIEGFPKDVERKIDNRMERLIMHMERAQRAIIHGPRKLWITDASSRDDPGDPDLDMNITPEVYFP